jgi:D-alanine-D-alanine ligase
MAFAHKTNVGVLRGGPSSEYEVSLQTGANIIKLLNDSEKYEPIDIFISRDGVWHIHGIPKEPHQALKKIDAVFNGLHGEYGEDGKVQHILETFSIPYTGSRQFPSVLAMNKPLAKNFLTKEGVKTPIGKVLKREDFDDNTARLIFRNMPHPSIVKPATRGSSVGVSIIESFLQLNEALQKVFEIADTAIIEEFIKGKEATCGVVDNFRNAEIYALLPIEISPPAENVFFDYDAKYSGKSKEICPGRFSREESEEIQRLAILAHKILGLRHYSRSDFIVHPRRGIFFLESNSLPGMTANSLFPKALEAVGCSQYQFVDHLLELALSGK